MTTHRARLRAYGARLLSLDGTPTVEMRDPNDRSQARYQYQRQADTLRRRVLGADGAVLVDWTPMTPSERLSLLRARGAYHPILDPLEI